jgi:gliding motility-associated protein GldC
MKTSEIKFTVNLDENKVPETIQWEATDSGMDGKRDCKATMLTVWDGKENTTLRIDLWTKDMLIDDMKRFFYENLMTMAESYQRATNDSRVSKEMKKYAEQFAKETELFSTP